MLNDDPLLFQMPFSLMYAYWCWRATPAIDMTSENVTGS